MSALAYASTGKSAPKKLEIPKVFVGDKNYSTEYNGEPMRDIDSPVKVLMEVNDESPTNYVARKLVGLLNSSHKQKRGKGNASHGLITVPPRRSLLSYANSNNSQQDSRQEQ